MAWVRIEDDFYDNDKFEAVGCVGVALQLAALAYCNRNLTDGIVPRSKVETLLTADGLAIWQDSEFDTNPLPIVVDQMVEVGLLHEAGHACSDCPQPPDQRKLVVHDYLRYQPSREQVERKREGSRERMAKSRRNRAERSPDVAGEVAAQHDEHTPRSSSAPNPNPKGEEGEPSSRSRKRSATTRGTRLPEIFPISPDMAEWGREHAPGVDASREHEKFCDYWRGASGQKGVKADWIATWRNWMRRAQERLDERNGHSPSKAADPGLPDWMLA